MVAFFRDSDLLVGVVAGDATVSSTNICGTDHSGRALDRAFDISSGQPVTAAARFVPTGTDNDEIFISVVSMDAGKSGYNRLWVLGCSMDTDPNLGIPYCALGIRNPLTEDAYLVGRTPLSNKTAVELRATVYNNGTFRVALASGVPLTEYYAGTVVAGQLGNTVKFGLTLGRRPPAMLCVTNFSVRVRGLNGNDTTLYESSGFLQQWIPTSVLSSNITCGYLCFRVSGVDGMGSLCCVGLMR